MSDRQYQNLDLQIEKRDATYVARVLYSPSGQATAAFRLPFTAVELENFVLRVGQARRTGVRRVDAPQMALAKEFGGALYRAVFSEQVLACLQSSRAEAEQEDAGLRIRLRLSTAPELINLPWEFLYDAVTNRFLALSVETPLVRYLDLPGQVESLAVALPLHILAMISSPADYPGLDTEREWSQLKAAVADLEERQLVTLERLAAPTLPALQRQLRRAEYHVLHFIGHGGFDPQADDGLLLLQAEDGRAQPISGQQLGMLLHDHRTLRLAVLNACEGARTSVGDPFAGVGQSLLQQGIPAVIAMQFEISDRAAIAFAHEFYAALADGYPIEAALAEARKAIFAQGDTAEWATPVLYSRSTDSAIFDIRGRKAVSQAPPSPAPPSAGPAIEPPRRSPDALAPAQPPASPGRKWRAGQVVALVAFFVAVGLLVAWGVITLRTRQQAAISTPVVPALLSATPETPSAPIAAPAMPSPTHTPAPTATPAATPTATVDLAAFQAHLDAGLAALDRGDHAAAVNECGLATQIRADSARAYFCLAFAHDQLGDDEQAVEAYGQTLALDPNYQAAYLGRGLLLANVFGDCEQATPDLEAYLQNPTLGSAEVVQAALDRCQGQ